MQNGTPLNRAELDAAKAATDDALARVSQGQLIDGAALATMEQHKQDYQQQLKRSCWRAITPIPRWITLCITTPF
ncbi:MAG: hypothetical protein ACRDCY_17910 [Aeromonas veronii]